MCALEYYLESKDPIPMYDGLDTFERISYKTNELKNNLETSKTLSSSIETNCNNKNMVSLSSHNAIVSLV